ncbi:MAG: hypothetical protein NXI04_00990 [Planctomycetaceae bacterium]|nr:hypothetical protein [Planctomycetaceae bacterium]
MKSVIRNLATCLMLLLSTSSAAFAKDGDDHVHKPIVVHSRPVIERLPLKVIHPIDVTVADTGDLFVADLTGVIFRIDDQRHADVMAKGLSRVSRVAAHRLGIFCLTSAGRAGSVIQFTENGFQSQPVSLNFAPAGLAVGDTGDLYVGNARRAEIVRLARIDERWQRTTISLPDAVRDVNSDAQGQIFVLLRDGRVMSLSAANRPQHLGYLPESSSRLSLHPTEGVLGVGVDDSLRDSLFRMTEEADRQERFASLPEGTCAVTFDELGNLTSANPDLRAITRVTSRFEVPCPHCGKPVPMILSPHAPPSTKRRSF